MHHGPAVSPSHATVGQPATQEGHASEGNCQDALQVHTCAENGGEGSDVGGGGDNLGGGGGGW